MKNLKKAVISLVACSFILSPSISAVNAEETSPNTNDETLTKMKKQDAELSPKIKNIYSKHAREIGDMKKEALEKAKVNTVKALNGKSQEALELAETKIKNKMHEQIDEIMSEYGWEKVEEKDDESALFTTASVSGDLGLTRNLYKNSSGYYTYYGYWDWEDGSWDSYADIEDILAIRSSKDITERVSAYIYSWDNYGYDRYDQVARRSWEADGAVFNVHDYLGYGYGGSMPMYYTDNGYASFTFKAPTGSEIYTHFEHNYKKYSTTTSATFDLINLSNSSFSVSYGQENYNWPTVSNPLTTK